MKFQNPFIFFIILASAIFFYKKSEGNTAAIPPSTPHEFKLVVDRGAFHYDHFELTATQVTYFPQENAQYDNIKYNSVSKTVLDSSQTLALLSEIKQKGFWKLENQYSENSSCLSQLTITLVAEGKTKTVICDDFERGCPPLIKYIDQKVVELEGNDLKRIYLPG